jgi:hypothetical protein
MTINSTSSTGCSNSIASQQSGIKQTKADFQALSTALQSGDLSGAQTAFAQLQKDNPRIAQALNSSSGSSASSGTSSSGSSPTSALQSLGSALQNGDLSGAQAALAQVQQNAPTQHAGHGHHHHGGAAASTDNATTTSSPTTTTASGAGSILNTTA